MAHTVPNAGIPTLEQVRYALFPRGDSGLTKMTRQQRMPPHKWATSADEQATTVSFQSHSQPAHPPIVADRDEPGSNNQPSRGYNDQYGRNGQSRPGSVIDYASSSQAPENPYPYNQNGQQRRPRYQSRQSTDQGVYGNGNQYGAPRYPNQRSYDNVTAMSGSAYGNTDSYGQSTDPSSLNSSVDQLQQRQNGSPAEYGIQGQNINGTPSPAPAASSTFVPSQAGMNVVKKPTNANDKRKSWFKRRFSKE